MEMLSFYMFIFSSVVILTFTLSVIFCNKIIYALLSSVIVFFSFAGLYFLLNATFNAVAQIAIYATGIATMLLFAIVLLGATKQDKKTNFKPSNVFALIGITVIGTCSYLLLADDFKEFLVQFNYGAASKLTAILDNTSIMGIGIFNNYLIAFELLSVLLLITVIGIGVVFLRPERNDG